MWKKGGSSTVLFLFSQVSSCIYASHLRFQPSHMIVCLAYEHCHLVVISKALIYTYKQGSLSRFGGHEKLWVITQLLRLKLHVWALKHQITELHISSWYSNISEFCKKFDFFSKITTYTNLQPKKKATIFPFCSKAALKAYYETGVLLSKWDKSSVLLFV